MLVYALLIGGSYPIGNAITDALEPVVLTAVRLLIAAVIVGLFCLHQGGLRIPTLKDFGRYCLISATITTFFVAMFEALRTATPLATGALSTLVPIMTVGIVFVISRQFCGLRQFFWVMAGGLAALWVVFDGDLEKMLALQFGRGEWIFLGGALAFAAYAPAIARLSRGESAPVLTFWTLVAGVFMLTLIGFNDILATDWQAVPSSVWSGIFYLAFFNTAFSFLLAKYASVRLPSHKVMSYIYLTPSIVAIAEGALGHGWPSLSVIAGIVAVAMVTIALQKS